MNAKTVGESIALIAPGSTCNAYAADLSLRWFSLSMDGSSHTESISGMDDVHGCLRTGFEYEAKSKWDMAIKAFESAARIGKRTQDHLVESFARSHQARALRNKGEMKPAFDCAMEAISMLSLAPDSSGKRFVQADTENILGTICFKLPLASDKVDAEGHFTSSTTLSEEVIAEILEDARALESFTFLGVIDKQSLLDSLRHDVCVNKINLAEILLHKGEPERAKANELADSLMAAANARSDWKLQAAAARIKGEIAELRFDWRSAATWFQRSSQAYERADVVHAESRAAVANKLQRANDMLSLEQWEAAGKPERFKWLRKVPRFIVRWHHPFLSSVDRAAELMPAGEMWLAYCRAAAIWSDAGWLNLEFRYVVKAIECLERMRRKMPLKGEFISETPTKFFSERAGPLLDELINLLLWPPAAKRMDVRDPIAEAFYFRERMGAIGLLDELEAGGSTAQVGSHSGQNFEGLKIEELVMGRVVHLSEVQEILPERTVLLEYVLTDTVFAVFVVTRHSVSVPIFESNNLRDLRPSNRSEEVANRVKQFLTSIGHELNEKGQSTGLARPHEPNLDGVKKQAQWLYNVLLRPTESIWWKDESPSADRLVIIPHGILHCLPFSTLFDGYRFLAEKISSVQLPSSSAYRYCIERRPNSAPPLTYFGFANPREEKAMEAGEAAVLTAAKSLGFTGNWIDNHLSNSSHTIHAVRRNGATRSAWVKNVSRCNCVLLDSHGGFKEGNPLRNCFLVNGDDGKPYRFTTRDVFLGPRMPSELLIASICHGGRVEIRNGDELVGLLRAFMFAGCRTILHYPWALSIAISEVFVKKFFQHLTLVSGANCKIGFKDAALQAAQKFMIDQGRNNGQPWEHPYYWAWIMVGDHI